MRYTHGSAPLMLLALALLIASAALVGVCEAKELVPMTEIFPTKRGNTKVNFTVRASRVSIPLVHSRKDGEPMYFEYTGRFYEIDDSGPLLPGPVLHVLPGGKIKMQVENKLGSEAPMNSSVDVASHMYTFHNPNTTNMHFHGMHSDPRIDDPFTVTGPGGSLFYKLGIPRDHLPGLHWYHAHSHGSVYYQIMGGLFGAIIVGESPLMTARVHPFRDWDSVILLIHLYRLTKPSTCDGMTMTESDVAIGTALPSDPKIVDRHGREYPLPESLLLVNGQHAPTVQVAKGKPLLFRVGFASGACHLNLTLPHLCEWHVVGYDGVQLPRTRRRRWVYFTTATRVEMVAVCYREGFFPVSDENGEAVFYVSSKANARQKNGVGEHKGKGKDSVSNSHDGNATVVTIPTFPVKLPKYSPDYLHLDSGVVVTRDISFSQLSLPNPKPYYTIGHGTNCSSLRNSTPDKCFYDHFEGQLGTVDKSKYRGFAVPLHSIVVARVYGDPTDPMPHPLHFHVNHFQFLSFEPRPGGQHANHTLEMYGVRRGQYRDTMPILDGVTTIRWQAATYPGEVVFHCHALHHEDRGMMTSYLVYKEFMPPVEMPTVQGESSHSTRDSGDGDEGMSALAWLMLAALAAVLAVGWAMYRRRSEGVSDDLVEQGLRVRSMVAGQPVATSEYEQVPLLPAGARA